MAAPPSKPSAEGSAAHAVVLISRGQKLLTSGDLAGYGRLLSELPTIEDPQRRHWATRNLLDGGLAAGAKVSRTRRIPLLANLASGALSSLESEPREPTLLNLAGVALCELSSLDAAEALFEAAKRLDPDLQQVDVNLAAVAKRRAARARKSRRGAHPHTASASHGAQPNTAPTARLHPSLAQLEQRALEVAAGVHPAQGLKLSLCMIVRDEQEMLPGCLTSLKEAVDEMVIVDTGSTDATVEIARSFGAKVIFHEWTGSFAEARNVSLEAASGDWLLCLDADEVLVQEDVGLLRSLTERTWREAFYLSETNYTGELEDGTAVTHNALRLFRNRPEYRYEGRLHEQIANRLPAFLPERMEASGVRIEHYGYLGAVRDSREKSRRNIELLRLQEAEGVDSAFLHYNLGSEYAAAGEPAAAVVELERAWTMMQADPGGQEFAPALTSRLVKALRASGRPADAIARAEKGLERFPGFTDLVLEQALCEMALENPGGARELLERCIAMGDAPGGYTATVGSGSYIAMVHLAELELGRGELEAAIKLLERCLREYPRFVGSVLPYASALLASGRPAEEVAKEVEGLVPDLTPAARFLLGSALYEGGATTSGETQFRAVLARQPHSSRARVALGEALLAQRRYAEAAATAAELADDDPLGEIARRTELFARIADGEASRAGGKTSHESAVNALGGASQATSDPSKQDTDEATDIDRALEGARAAGMTDSEIDLFRAWRDLSGSGTTAIALAAEAVQPLVVMLEALLRVQDFQTFEVLLGALERTPVTERDRRELLADVYLRRGFETSAAEEWMAVCEAEPDARALLGLARVAAARGMTREAENFAAAALERDPDNALAASLLSHAQALAA
ncbi:MAG: glycosyltransferase [Solirubrobacteraceae bacterium]